jgi:Ni,Fe-hydrogenase III small subunit
MVIGIDGLVRPIERQIRRTCADSGGASDERQTYEAMPDPKIVVPVGDCGSTGGIFGEGYASCGRVADFVAVNVVVPGCPPSPPRILQGILTAIA